MEDYQQWFCSYFKCLAKYNNLFFLKKLVLLIIKENVEGTEHMDNVADSIIQVMDCLTSLVVVILKIKLLISCVKVVEVDIVRFLIFSCA